MEISGNSLNQPVNFYTKNTGNTINMAIDKENALPTQNIFASEFVPKASLKNHTLPIKKKRKNKRLNTIDTDYLPAEPEEPINSIQEDNNNFFITKEENKISEKFKKTVDNIFTSTPLINYFFLKEKKQKLQKTVEILNDISQNVDELLNTSVPYGEENNVYKDIAKNLTDAAGILGKASKNI